MKSYLVTGGAGFIGSHLVDALLGRGDNVRVLDNLSTGRVANVATAADFVEGDIRDPSLLTECLSGVDGCFHLAAVSSVHGSPEVLTRAHEVNLVGARNVFDAVGERAAAGSTIPVVFASSAAVYGDIDTVPVSEQAACAPISTYGADKLAVETYARTVCEKSDVPSIGLRLFNVYGPRQDPSSPYSGVINVFLGRLVRGNPVEIYGDGNQVRDFVYVDDAVRHFLAAMDSLTSGSQVFNVCTGRCITINQLHTVLKELTGAGGSPLYKPARAGDIKLSVGDPRAAVERFSIRADTGLRDGLQSTLCYLRQCDRGATVERAVADC